MTRQLHALIAVASLGLLPTAGWAGQVDGVQIEIRGGPGQDIPVSPGLPLSLPQGPARDGAPARTGTGVIRGRVLAADTGAPLRRVQIRVLGAELREARIVSTDQDGRYEIKDLPEGRFTLTANKGGYVGLQFGQRRPGEPGTPIQLAEKQVIEKVDFSLPRGGVIAGRVVDEFGDPVTDVMVQVMSARRLGGRPQMMSNGRPAMTNDIGEYRVFGLMPGQYYVSATFRNMGMPNAPTEDRTGYAPTYYPGTPSQAEAQRLTLTVGQEMANVDLTLVQARTATIAGTVIDSRGRPLSSGFVMLRERAATMVMFSFGGQGQIRPDGSFALTGVVPGEYSLDVRSSFGPPGLGGGGPAGEAEFASVPVTIAGADITGLSIVTGKGATARGQVVVDPAASDHFDPSTMRVVALSADQGPGFGMPTAPQQVREDGTFEIAGLMGPRMIRLFGTGTWLLKAVYLNGQDMTDAPIDFTRGEVSGLQVVVTNRAASVAGTVVDEKRQPVKDYAVVLFPDDSDKWGAQSRYLRTARPDQDGKFEVKGLPEGRYLGFATEYLEQGAGQDPEFLEQIRRDATPFVLGDGESKSLELKLSIVAMP